MFIVVNGEVIHGGCEDDDMQKCASEEEADAMMQTEAEFLRLPETPVVRDEKDTNTGGDLHIIKHYGFGREQIISCGTIGCTEYCQYHTICNLAKKG